MTKFYIEEAGSYCRGNGLGVAYCAETAEEISAIIKSKKNPWNDLFVTVNNVTYPAYVWTVEKIEETMRKGA